MAQMFYQRKSPINVFHRSLSPPNYSLSHYKFTRRHKLVSQPNSNAHPSRAIAAVENGSNLKKKVLLFEIVLFLVSVAGLTFNVNLMTTEYLSYSVVSEVLVSVPHELDYPSMTLCTAYHKLIDPSSDGDPKNMSGRKLDKEKKKRKADFEPTVEQIFQLTPNEDEIVVNCSYRKPNDIKSFIKYSTHCNHALGIVKYVHLNQVCYKITYRDHDHIPVDVSSKDGEQSIVDSKSNESFRLIKSNDTFNYHNIKYHILSLDSFLQIIINGTLFSKATSFDVSIFSPEKFVRGNDVFNVQLKRGTLSLPNDREHKKDYYFISFQRVSTTFLPPPYKTNCISYSKHNSSKNTQKLSLINELDRENINNRDHNSRQECIDHCINSKVTKQFNLVPFTTVTLNSTLNQTMISLKKISKCSFQSRLKTIEHYCLNYCQYSDCYRTLFVTKFMRSEIIEDKLPIIKFRIMAPVDGDINVDYFPYLTMSDYIANISSCLGIWLGLCLMDSTKLLIAFLSFILTFFKCLISVICHQHQQIIDPSL